jgi:hypothetical protein
MKRFIFAFKKIDTPEGSSPSGYAVSGSTSEIINGNYIKTNTEVNGFPLYSNEDTEMCIGVIKALEGRYWSIFESHDYMLDYSTTPIQSVPIVHFYQKTFKDTPDTSQGDAYQYVNGWHYDYHEPPTSVEPLEDTGTN